MSISSELTALREAIDAKLPAEKRGKKTISQMTESIENIQNGSGAFDMVTVTKYTPEIPAGTNPQTVCFSGFIDKGTIRFDDDTVLTIAFSIANGTYEVTPETKDLPEKERIYYHQEYPYVKLKHIDDPWNDIWITGWAIFNPNSATALAGWYKGEIMWFMPERSGYLSFIGENEWLYNIDGGSSPFQITATVAGSETHPDIPAVIEGYKATSYNNGQWNFEDTLSTFSAFDTPPELGNIYAATGKSLIGDRVDALPLYTSDSNTVLMLNFNDGTPKDVSRFSHEIRSEGGEITTNGYSGKGWNFKGGYLTAVPHIDGSEVGTEFVFGQGDFTWEAYVYPTSTNRQCLFAYGEDYVFGVCFSYQDNNCKLSVFGNIPDEWSETDISEPLQLNKWQHVAIVRKGNVLYCFINFKCNGYLPIIESVGAENNMFSIGRWGGDPSDFSARWQGYMDDIRISNIARYEL